MGIFDGFLECESESGWSHGVPEPVLPRVDISIPVIQISDYITIYVEASYARELSVYWYIRLQWDTHSIEAILYPDGFSIDRRYVREIPPGIMKCFAGIPAKPRICSMTKKVIGIDLDASVWRNALRDSIYSHPEVVAFQKKHSPE